MDINISEANQFINLHAHPQKVNSNDSSLINSWVAKYPYCQTLHILATQASKSDEEAESYLSRAATFASNREVLFKFTIKPEDFGSEPVLLDHSLITTNKITEPQNDMGQAFGANLNYYKVEEVAPETEKTEETVEESVGDISEEEEENQTEETAPETEKTEETVEESVGDISEEEENQTEEVAPETEKTEETVEESVEDISEEEEENQTEETAPETEKTEEAVEEENRRTLNKDDELVFESPIATDFFAFANAEKPSSVASPLNRQEQKTEDRIPLNAKEEVSQYNDETLPYTFLWWLNKTRKEHATNTQPYVKFTQPTPVKQETRTDQSLNHQIAENIFHLRGAEEIAATQPKNQTVPFDFRKKEFNIINKFIKEEPQIKPPAANKIDSENKAKKSSEDANQVVSETLAKIYAEQMLYHKALDVYKKLSLKYPEKSTYFASQIKYLELKVN
ncbi:MAG TPA: hypothetical protein VFM79_06075 [Pelobium sp.]|nr:hypothetical protein [Pelobium sp.]